MWQLLIHMVVVYGHSTVHVSYMQRSSGQQSNERVTDGVEATLKVITNAFLLCNHIMRDRVHTTIDFFKY